MAAISAATVAATAGAVASGVGTGMSFYQAGQQKKKAAEANAAANKAMAEARKRLEVNYAEALSIQKEPYRLERERSRAAGAQLTEAARESERGAAAAAGRIYGMEHQAQADIGVRMGQELIDRERAIIEEDMRLADIGAQMSLDEVKGAQLAAREADERAALAKAQGVQGVVDYVGALGQLPELYGGPNAGSGADASTNKVVKYGEGAKLGSKPVNLGGVFPQFQELDKALGVPLDVQLGKYYANNPFAAITELGSTPFR